MVTFQAPWLDVNLLLGISPARGLHSNYYSRMTPVDFACSQARGLYTNNYSTWLIWLSYLEGYSYKSTQMMAFTNIEDPWIDYLII
jgi:hypothetical protein